ncbi:Adenine phosphoribosyltransferase [Ignavibacterium album JCM 16511]|uniref:Adenine phosphoribosyltransferase n=1 Tax=Ignavibacterium album (strain DSM 19864 / JCM 16511 / NBRC 101810 / Mat9-16) TaxID=945713 RepID=I0AJM6_IGNAJ|nr:adenine phosphoribosyltransferase [Ignavibacterium album]AFH49183.1 Adenine phosphoribosyltransferase [Ignavibacterium album JCM 16511]
MNLKEHIRNVKDFPKQGIMFRDITTLLKNPEAMKYTSEKLLDFAKGLNVDKVVGIESRGFIFGSILSEKLNAGFIPVRKPGKLPAEKEQATYQLEYGTDTLEIHKDAIVPGDNVLIHDDLLATGGTMEAVCKMIEKLGGNVVQISFIIELSFLKGRDKLKNYDVRSIVEYDSEE